MIGTFGLNTCPDTTKCITSGLDFYIIDREHGRSSFTEAANLLASIDINCEKFILYVLFPPVSLWSSFLPWTESTWFSLNLYPAFAKSPKLFEGIDNVKMFLHHICKISWQILTLCAEYKNWHPVIALWPKAWNILSIQNFDIIMFT